MFTDIIPGQSNAPVAGLAGVAFAVGISWLFFWFTAQVAATYVLGTVPWRRSAVVGFVPTVIVVALSQFSPALIIMAVLLGDGAVIRIVYRLGWPRTLLVTLMHVVASIVIAIPAIYVFELLATAPV